MHGKSTNQTSDFTKGDKKMKRIALRCIMMLCVLAWAAAPVMATKDGKGVAIKGKEVSITGKITCTFCKLAHPDKTCEQGCCERCIKAGDPPLLTAEDGNQYILLTGEHEVPLMTPERFKMLGHAVSVKGMMVTGKGVQAIYVDAMETK
jgi:hypothetical protein